MRIDTKISQTKRDHLEIFNAMHGFWWSKEKREIQKNKIYLL
jgi:hypothetical protein